MITLNIHDIRKQPGLSMIWEYEDTPDIAEVELADKVSATLKLTNVSSRILVEGSIRTAVKLECARCLADYVCPLEFSFVEEFLPEGSPELVEKEKLDWEDLNLFSFSDDILDIYEMIRQNIITALPVKPLCSEGCKGLCPVCGKSRNTETCSCPVEEDEDEGFSTPGFINSN
ncbi:MAG: DUF177 domain-containing protein [Firmicutes bacterium]|nr:DUF177 domain-containing protein [Bacillota bacterium]